MDSRWVPSAYSTRSRGHSLRKIANCSKTWQPSQNRNSRCRIMPVRTEPWMRELELRQAASCPLGRRSDKQWIQTRELYWRHSIACLLVPIACRDSPRLTLEHMTGKTYRSFPKFCGQARSVPSLHCSLPDPKHSQTIPV